MTQIADKSSGLKGGLGKRLVDFSALLIHPEVYVRLRDWLRPRGGSEAGLVRDLAPT